MTTKAAILIVDDRPANLLALEVALEPLGAEVLKASSARAAFEHLAEREVAVILLDVHMPEMDGLQAAQLIRSRPETRHTPIIFLTAHTPAEGIFLKAYEEGAVDFLGKPVVPEVLRSKITFFLQLFEQSRRLREREAEVLRLNAELERRVEARTAELQAEVVAHRRTEERARRQLRQLAALRTIDMAITGSIDLRVILSVVLDQVTAELHVSAASVLLVDPATRQLRLTATRGFRLPPAPSSPAGEVGEGLAGRVALHKKVICAPEDEGERRLSEMYPDEEFVAYCGVPLIVKGQALGVLEIYNRRPMPDNPDWQDFLEALAGQAAIAIDNAALFENLSQTNLELSLAYDRTIEGWSRALDLRDKETEGHSRRVTEMSLRLAELMGFPHSELVQVRRGALLHDIGKMGIPDSILLKPAALTPEEWELMKMHPVYAYELLSPIEFLRPALDVPYCHHEKWDGSGYPRGLSGSQIPLAARIFAVVDVWDALQSDRPYRPGWPMEKVMEHVLAGSGTHFDPEVVAAFTRGKVWEDPKRRP